MPADIYFHKQFKFGNIKTEFFTDYLNLSENEFDLLLDFIEMVQEGDSISGRNIMTGQDIHGAIISVAYNNCALWHYHVGPYNDPEKFSNCVVAPKKIRDLYWVGKTSKAVVHYKWYDPSTKKKLVILAFSPKHNPFPDPKDKSNPLPKRGGGLFRNEDIEKFSPPLVPLLI